MWSVCGRFWYGREQVENKSPENVRRCYAWQARQPYLSEEDRRRIRELGEYRAFEAGLEQ